VVVFNPYAPLEPNTAAYRCAIDPPIARLRRGRRALVSVDVRVIATAAIRSINLSLTLGWVAIDINLATATAEVVEVTILYPYSDLFS
jgi:hypothetical protein